MVAPGAPHAARNIAVVIPCYNEHLTVGEVVRQFRAELPHARIYVFDNNSTDRTAEAALQAGMRAALGIIVVEFPSAYAPDPQSYLAQGLALRDRWRVHPLASFCFIFSKNSLARSTAESPCTHNRSDSSRAVKSIATLQKKKWSLAGYNIVRNRNTMTP